MRYFHRVFDRLIIYQAIGSKERAMYTYHFDHPNQQWNVFQIVNGREEYRCSFKTLEEVNEYIAPRIMLVAPVRRG